MRNALILLVLVLSLAACGKKKSPAAPANTKDESARPGEEREEQDMARPVDQDDDASRSADPCEGGE